MPGGVPHARLVGALVCAGVLAPVGCRDATEHVVALDAVPEVRKRATSLRVRMCGDEGTLRLDETVPLGPDAAWPARVPLTPRGDDAGRTFALVAELSDADGASVGRQRVIAGFRADEGLETRRTFTEACANIPCGRDETCEAGACVDARLGTEAFPCAPEIACASDACPAPPSHLPGHVWRRSADFSAGTKKGSTRGNPNDDDQGVAVWHFETVVGGTGLLGDRPWYTLPGRLMTWDDAYYGGAAVWSLGDDLSPAIGDTWLDHPLVTGRDVVPLVRWENPTGRDVVVRIAGRLTVAYRDGAIGAVEVAIARAGGGGQAPVRLAEGTIVPGGPADIDVRLDEVPISRHGALLVTMRGQETRGWVRLTDDLTIELLRPPP